MKHLRRNEVYTRFNTDSMLSTEIDTNDVLFFARRMCVNLSLHAIFRLFYTALLQNLYKR